MLSSLLAFSVLAKHGAFLLVGGGKSTDEMVEAFADLCGGKEGEIVVLTQAQTNSFDEGGSADLLKSKGFKRVTVLASSNFEPKSQPIIERLLSRAKGIWVTGEDQTLFIKRFGLAWSQELFPKLIERGVNWFGTSAGAMVVANPMITDDGTTEGIGLIDAVVDTHYFVRHRELRLRNAFFGCRVQYGFGLDEGEWVVVRDNLIEKKVGLPQIFLRE